MGVTWDMLVGGPLDGGRRRAVASRERIFPVWVSVGGWDGRLEGLVLAQRMAKYVRDGETSRMVFSGWLEDE